MWMAANFIIEGRRLCTVVLNQGFPTFFAARTPLSGQSILSTPKKILRYILLYKRYTG